MINGMMKILAIGDIVGISGSEYIRKYLWKIRTDQKIDFTIANGENAAKGNGLDVETAKLLFSSGVDVLTSGNHIWNKREIRAYLENETNVLRPANYPDSCPGNGYCITEICGYRFLVLSLLGTVYLESLESPFTTADRILKNENGNYDFSLIDFHAEATSEKQALAKYLDGRVNIVFGTHTHVQTADEKILPHGTAFITDLGMTGPYNSILGIKNEIIIEKFLTKMPVRFEEGDGEVELCGAVFTLDLKSKSITDIQRIKLLGNPMLS
jgi:metallophosphoesterase, MG_246/BB_0505 family